MATTPNTLTAIMPKILARGLRNLRQFCIMPQLVNNDYSMDARAKGDTIDVPVPVAATSTAVTHAEVPPAPATMTPTKVQIQLDNWEHSNFHLSDKDLLSIDKNKHFLPMQAGEAIKAIANSINESIFSEYVGVYGYAGTAGTTPFVTTVAGATDLRKVLHRQLCPKDQRRVVLDFDAEANALALAPFRDTSQSNDPNPITEGQIGRKFGMDWFADHHVPTHTAGTITTGLATKAATVEPVGETSIVCTTAGATGACDLKEGDIILIDGDDQTYTLTADAVQAVAATDVTLTISPGLKVATTGGEAVTVKASHVVNLGFHRDAFALAMRPLQTDLESEMTSQLGSKIISMQDPISGLILRLEVSRQYKQVMWDFDALWGVKLVRPELAARLAG